jgi:hypothetical protein
VRMVGRSCPMVGFGVSGVETLGSDSRALISKMDLREICCEDGRWMELAQDCVQWRHFLLA